MEELCAILAPILGPILTGAAAWVLTRVPGPLKDFLYASVHQKDIALLLGAMARRATAQSVPEVPTGQGPEDIIAYVRAELPGLVAKLHLSDEALRTVAASAIVQTSPAAVPVVMVDPTQP